MINPLDKYDLGARLGPSLIVLFPVELICFAWVSKWEDLFKPFFSAAVGAGISLYLANIARYYGKLAEAKLVSKWGGMPSTIMLRRSNSLLDAETKRRYYEALGQLVPGVRMPTEAEEQADPAHADDVYKSCCSWLLEQTRDNKRFELLFKENISYGYHRNLFGLRPIAVSISLFALACCLWKVISDYKTHAPITPISIICVAVALGFVLGWLFTINSDYVRQAGDAYAKRLLASCDVLVKAPSAPETKSKPKSRKKEVPDADSEKPI